MRDIITLGIILLIPIMSLSNCIQIPIQLGDKIGSSERIVEGEIINKRSEWNYDHTMIETYYTVRPSVFIKGGNVNGFITFKSLGGQVGTEKIIIEPGIELELGTKGVFFLKRSNKNEETFEVYASTQGIYEYDREKNKAITVFEEYQLDTDELIKRVEKRVGAPSIRVANLFSEESNIVNRMLVTLEFSASPSIITAGTHSVLTLTGSGFGEERGARKVQFLNSNTGGRSKMSAYDFDYISWSDTEIKVRFPSNAGSGNVFIVDENNNILGTSVNKVTVPFNRTSVSYKRKTPNLHLADINKIGGITYLYSEEFFKNTKAVDRFESALAKWTCSTGVNWHSSTEPTSVNVSAKDGKSVVMFADTSSPYISPGVLGVTISRISGCIIGEQQNWYISDIDLIFNKEYTWNYSIDNPARGTFDFESVALHELGHAHQQGHVINKESVMHYSFGTGKVKRNLTSQEILGGQLIVKDATNFNYCGANGMVEYNSTPALFSKDQCSSFTVNNPAKGNWNSIMQDGQFVLSVNPGENNFARLDVSIYDSSKDVIVEGASRATLGKSFEFNAYDSNGTLITNMIDTVKLRLPYEKDKVEGLMKQAGAENLSELVLVKNENSCGSVLEGVEESNLKIDFKLSPYGCSNYFLECGVTGFSNFYFTTKEQLRSLPVTWGSFTASQINSSVHLNWSTHTESNSRKFIIQRSVDSVSWNLVAESMSKGDSKKETHYNAIDTAPLEGVAYYRIKQVDNDDLVSYSKLVSVNYKNKEIECFVKNKMVTLSGLKENTKVDVYSLSGQVVYEKTGFDGGQTLNLTELPSGFYLLKYESGSTSGLIKLSLY